MNSVPINIPTVLAEVDAALAQPIPREQDQVGLIAMGTRIDSCIRRYASIGSAFDIQADAHRAQLRQYGFELTAIDGLLGVLRALRYDIANDLLRSMESRITADILADLLGQAQSLLDDKLLLPAAVLAGAALEEHLHKLCVSLSIPLHDTNGKPEAAATLNIKLKSSGLYHEAERAQIEAWQKVRNQAAHGLPEFKTQELRDIERLITGIRDFVVKYPS